MINLLYLKNSGTPLDDHYLLIDKIGGGGFSEVWLANDMRSGVDVVLKVYASSGELNDEGVKMFRKEFALVCNLNHTNILKPFTFDIYQGSPYIVLPFCERGSASKLVGKITEEEIWNFLGQVAAGLAHLHKHQIIHQDIKPANVLINADGQYMITDFGISTGLRNTIRRTVTNDNSGSGTTAYMSYECLKSDPTNVIARDIWALGATLFELLTGDVPFGEYGGLNQKSENKKVPKISKDVSPELKDLIYRCLAFNTWDRPSAEEILQAVEDHKKGKIINKQLIKPKILIATVISALIVGSFFLWPRFLNTDQKVVYNPNDSLLIAKIEIANEIVNQEKSKPHESRIEDSLINAFALYTEAVNLDATDSIVEKGHLMWKPSQDVIDETYLFLCDKGNEYNRIGATSAFQTFRKRSEKLEPLVSK